VTKTLFSANLLLTFCRSGNPNISLQTTYKKRCLHGLKHPDPSSPDACHKPSLGALSKYCSAECGIKCQQMRIDSWTKKGGKKEKLWESVKGAEKREGVVVCVEENDDEVKVDFDGGMSVKKTSTKKGTVEREVEELNMQLDRMVQERELLKKEMEIIVWRERLIELATERSERLDQCGWDQRLCFGNEEWSDFGAGVLESYEEEGNSMQVDSTTEGDGEWWCAGKKKCDRHAG
jgi:COMPASS component SPP1